LSSSEAITVNAMVRPAASKGNHMLERIRLLARIVVGVLQVAAAFGLIA
jgi:hypothetical protein